MLGGIWEKFRKKKDIEYHVLEMEAFRIMLPENSVVDPGKEMMIF